MIKEWIKNIVNVLLKFINLKLCSINDYNQLHKYFNQEYINLIEEIEGFFREIIFPKLPTCNNRIELLAKLLGTQVSEAMYLLNYLHESLRIEGDVCEFGVAQGATSALLANEIRQTQRILWLFDSFKGLSRPSFKDSLINDIFSLGSIEKYEGTMSCPAKMVKNRLKEISFPFSRIKIISGFVEETLDYKSLVDKICFAYVDFDFYQPTFITLKFLDKHLSGGGFIIVDDYGFFSTGVKTAVDEFLIEHESNYAINIPPDFAGHFCILQKKL